MYAYPYVYHMHMCTCVFVVHKSNLEHLYFLGKVKPVSKLTPVSEYVASQDPHCIRQALGNIQLKCCDLIVELH